MTANQKLDQLTFLRFVAAIVVVIYHYGDKAWKTGLTNLMPSILAGPLMVTFFFVLSGFIMTIAYGNQNEIDKGRFWVARYARIAPAYYLAMIIKIIALYLNGVQVNIFGLSLPVFFLQSWVPLRALYLNGPAWSLSVEMFFYLIFPFCISLIKKFSISKSIALILVYWGLNVLAIYFLVNSQYFQNADGNLFREIAFYFPLLHLITFFVGIAGGIIYNKYLSKLQVSKVISGSLVISIFLIMLLSFKNFSRFAGLLEAPRLSFVNGLFAPMFLFLILTLSIDHSIISGILSKKVFVFLGDLGYSVYIFQNPLKYIYSAFIEPIYNLTPSQDFYVYTFLLICFSAITYILVEKPMRSKLRKLAEDWFFKQPVKIQIAPQMH